MYPCCCMHVVLPTHSHYYIVSDCMNKLQFIPWLIEIWFFSSVDLFLNRDCQTGLPCTFLDLHMYTFLLGICIWNVFLYQRVCIHSALVDTAKQFSKGNGSIYSPRSRIWEFQVLYIFFKTFIFNFVGLAVIIMAQVKDI